MQNEWKSLAVVFPGQGAQRPGMGQDFAQSDAESMRLFDEASAALDVDLKQICFTEDERLNLTEFTQPAILTMEIVVYRYLQKQYQLTASFFAGHSLGEYSALVAAEVIPFVDAVKIVRKRGALMQQAVPEGKGSMAAVILESVASPEFSEIVTGSGADIANYNSGSQIVISGSKEGVEKASQALEAQYPGIKIVPLNVSAPFHSRLMKEIEAEFRDYLQGFSRSFQFERAEMVASNFTGSFHEPQRLLDNLVDQISGSVRWIENMELMRTHANEILELGPNRVLTKFFATIGVEVPTVFTLRSAEKLFPKS